MDILTLRTTLATELTNHLGTYTLGNGSTTDSIAVRDPGVGMPAGTTCTGLEVIIISVPELAQNLQYEDSPFAQTWDIFLVDWGGGDPEGAAVLVQSGFPGTTSNIVSVTEDNGPKRQLQLRIPLSRDGGQSAFQVPPTLQVQSVNGLTGYVSLGINDMDDVEVPNTITDDAVLVWDSANSKYRLDEQTSYSLTDGGNF